MKKLQLGKEFYIALIIAVICSITLLCILQQEDVANKACIAIVEGNNDTAIGYIDELWNLNTENSDNMTPLMAACKSGNETIIYHLITLRADLNFAPPGMMTPLELYCQYGYKNGYEPIISMLKSGCKQSNYTVKPALYHLTDHFYWSDNKEKEELTEACITLLQNGAPLGFGNTSILHLAAKGNMDRLFNSVVHTTQGITLMDMKDENGKTPWDIALESGSIKVQRVIRNLEQEWKDEVESEKEELIPSQNQDNNSLNETIKDEVLAQTHQSNNTNTNDKQNNGLFG